MRILVTVEPRMYRESLALSLHQQRPDLEVVIGSPGHLDGEAESFRTHLLVRNDADGVDMGLQKDALCWVEILYSDGMDARISLDGEVWMIEDICVNDLLKIVDRAEALTLRDTTR